MYLDTGKHNSFIRLRRDHLQKLGHHNLLNNEIDEHYYRKWKIQQEQLLSNNHKEEELNDGKNEEVLFSFDLRE